MEQLCLCLLSSSGR